MRWPLTHSSPASCDRRATAAPVGYREQTESIRAALLESLKESATEGGRDLQQRIRYAGDAERLWYLRPEAMSVLASMHGEAHAREALARISTLFRDVLPDGLASRLRSGCPSIGPVHSQRPANVKETA